MKRNINLDLIKIVGCIVVMGIHSLILSDNPFEGITSFFLLLNYCGVPLFMSITGYTLFNRKEVSTKQILKKITRYIKYVAIWILIIYILCVCFVYKARHNIGVDNINPIFLPKIVIETLLGVRSCSCYFVLLFIGALILVYLFSLVYNKFKNQKRNNIKGRNKSDFQGPKDL